MATITEVLFFISFFILIGIILFRLYNVLSGFVIWDYRINIILFVSQLLMYIIGLVTSMISYDSLTITQMFKLDILSFWIANILFIVELVATISQKALENQRGRYTPNQNDR